MQVGFVVGDLLQLARVPARDALAEDILTTLVQEVYRNEVPRNRPGGPKHEPRARASGGWPEQSWPFKGAAANRAEELRLALGSVLSATAFWMRRRIRISPDASPLDVYELDSLEQFPGAGARGAGLSRGGAGAYARIGQAATRWRNARADAARL
jgi:hypothetical protein